MGMKNLMKNKRICLQVIVVLIIILSVSLKTYAEPTVPIPQISIDIGTSDNPRDVSSSITILLLLTVLSMAPSILMMMTSFTRIIIVLSFLRSALGTQQMPPNQVLIGLALFLSLFIMMPIGKQINQQAFEPYTNGQISQQQALDNTSQIMKKFMLKQTLKKDLDLFVSLSGEKEPVEEEKLSLAVIIPAFLISELKTAFQIGFLIYVPFLVIDMVVSSTLMSMGMMMLSPVMISLPFKLLLFILVDGWNLLSQALINSFVK
jgi:flagellar biosynthetic protein FliP